MNVRVVALFLFLGIVGTGLSVHFRKQQVVTPGEVANRESGDIPVPPKHGPFAKAVVTGEPLFDFGVMEQGQKGEHQFVIRNEGEAPLQLVARMDDHLSVKVVSSPGFRPFLPRLPNVH